MYRNISVFKDRKIYYQLDAEAAKLNIEGHCKLYLHI